MLGCGALAVSTLAGQELRLSSAIAGLGDRVAIEVALESPEGREPLALQWTASIPLANLIPEQILLGTAAQQANKTIHCIRADQSGSAVYHCVVAGGQAALGNGAMALIILRILAKARPGREQLRTEKGIAVSKETKKVSIPDASASVTIRVK